MSNDPSAEPVVKSKRSPTCFVGASILGMILLVILVLLVSFFVSTPLEISEETTFITEPLKADGRRVDYFAAIEQETYPENIATEENGFRLIVERVDLRGEYEPWYYREMCEKLGLDPATNSPDLPLIGVYSFAEEYTRREGFDPSELDHLRSKPEVGDTIEIETDDETATDGVADEGDEGEDVAEEDADAFAAYDENASEYNVEHWLLIERRSGRPWTLEDLPMMEEWLDKVGPTLDVVAEAVRKPTFKVPLVREDEDDLLVVYLLPNAQVMREFARCLAARAHYRVGTGDIDGAIDDIITCKRLGRHVGHGSTLVEMLVGIAIEGIADAIGAAGSLEHPPGKEQLQRLLDEYDDLPPRASFDRAMRFERYMSLDILQTLAIGGSGDTDDMLAYDFGGAGKFTRWIGLDWNIVMSRYNDHFDAILAKGALPSRPGIGPGLFLSRAARSEAAADVLASMILPGCQAAEEAGRRADCAQNMKRITLAMLLYECDHGTLPPAYTVDEDGNPLHSWRVLLLPYLKQKDLYDKIRLDEPWDSEHNAKLHGEAVAFYQCPSAGAKAGETNYCVVVGPETPFEASEGKNLADFGPDSADMILVVETTQAFCWMDPTQEITQADADAGVNGFSTSTTNAISSNHPGGANVGRRDAATWFLSEVIDNDVFKSLLRGTNKETYY